MEQTPRIPAHCLDYLLLRFACSLSSRTGSSASVYSQSYTLPLIALPATQMAISRVYREAVDPLLPPAPGVRTPPLPPHVRMCLCTGTAPLGGLDAAAQDAAGEEEHHNSCQHDKHLSMRVPTFVALSSQL